MWVCKLSFGSLCCCEVLEIGGGIFFRCAVQVSESLLDVKFLRLKAGKSVGVRSVLESFVAVKFCRLEAKRKRQRASRILDGPAAMKFSRLEAEKGGCVSQVSENLIVMKFQRLEVKEKCGCANQVLEGLIAVKFRRSWWKEGLRNVSGRKIPEILAVVAFPKGQSKL